MSKKAHIVAIRVMSLDTLGWGISSHPREAQAIMDMAEVWIGPRPDLEEDFDFVQPIPYIMVKKDGKYLAYTRSTKGGDDRLHSKVSIGFGGHVDALDSVVDDEGVIDLHMTMINAMKRELKEELGVTLTLREVEKLARFTHVISSHKNDVDRVHIGFVATLDITEGTTFVFEAPIENARYMTREELLAGDGNQFELESWTRLVLEAA